MKLGTNDLHIILIIKIQCSLYENPKWPQKSKMAATKYGFVSLFPKLSLISDNTKNKLTQTKQTAFGI